MPYRNEIDEEETGSGDEVGTILRPLHRPQQGYIAPWERDPGAKSKPMWDSTIRWGDAVEVSTIATANPVTADLLNVKLPRSVVAQVQFRADIIRAAPIPIPFLLDTTLELVVGNGSQLTVVRKRYNNFPQVGAPATPTDGTPLDVLFTFPLTSVRGRVTARGAGLTMRYALWLSPLFEVK